jgi:cell division septum initiation protein DivIVA
MDIIDQMRISIPEEIKKAQQIISQKDRILAQAQEEANRTVSIAREKSERMVEKSDTYQSAQSKSDDIPRQAQLDAEQAQHDADRYVAETLLGLERELKRVLTQVENGINAVQPKEQE